MSILSRQMEQKEKYIVRYMRAIKEQEKLVESVVQKDASIIMADDNAINRMLLLKMLKSSGYGATLVNDGRELTEVVNPDVHKLIITDLKMPHMTGLEAAIEIKSRYKEKSPKIVLLTGDALTDIAMTSNIIDKIVYKPCTKKDLCTTIKQLLQ